MTVANPTVTLIQAAAQRDAETFASKMADSSLEAAVDIWLKRVARRKATPCAAGAAGQGRGTGQRGGD